MAIEIGFQSVFQTSATPAFNVGTEAQTPDGRKWTYCEVSTGGLAKGSVGVPTAVTAVDTVSSSTDAYGRIVYITKAAAGWTPGAFTDGWVIVDDGTGVGQAGKIAGNTATTLQLYPEYAFTTALAVADSDITITQVNKVVKSAITSLVQNATGVAQVAMSAGTYGWLLKQGQGVVLAGAALVVGEYFTTGDDTTGQVIPMTNGETIDDVQIIGRALVANAAADQLAQVYVNIV